MKHDIYIGQVLDGLALQPAGHFHCCVTSPPYWGLRDYGVDGQIGLEPTPDAFIARMVEVFRGVHRVLRDDGTLWLNLGDSYAGSGRGGYAGNKSTLEGYTDSQEQSRVAKRRLKAGLHENAVNSGAIGREWVPPPAGMKCKDLMMMPWRVALALQADGWYVRSSIVWHKRSPMPESVTDRPTSAWEPIFLLTKSERYFYDAEAVREASQSTDPRTRRAPGDVAAGSIRNADLERYGTSRGKGNQSCCNPAGRNMRNVWTLSSEPYPEAHFATFPTEIPRRAIKAGTSERGCCPACGAPWARIVESSRSLASGSGRSGRLPKGKHADGLQGGGETGDIRRGPVVSTTTLGWQPTCTCPAHQPVPCRVLDPFLGSGTTLAVAAEQGRDGLGCELNPQYAALARDRIGKAAKPNTYARDVVLDAPLFGGVA